jgi:Gpi18-like mannosyltransferase
VHAPEPARRGPDLVIIGALLVGALVVRVLALPIDGHDGDVTVMARWAERMVEVGPISFYEGSGSIYPALLYPLWLLGALLDGDALDLAIKAQSIPWDLAIGALLYLVLDRRFGAVAATIGASLYLFNPGVIMAGPAWGQVDAAGTLFVLAAAVAGAHRSFVLGGALAVVAMLMKPQFGIAVVAIGVAALWVAWRDRRWQPPFDAIAGGAVAYGVIAIPLALSPFDYLGLLGETAARHPVTSLYAFNPWALVAPFDSPDEPYVAIGLGLLVVGLIGSLVPIRRGSTLAAVLAVSALLALSLYFLPTRVHERYLFPVLALLVPFAAVHLRLIVPYVVLSVVYALTLVYTLVVIAGLDVPLANLLVSDASLWVLALTLMGSALWFVVELLRGPPPLDADAPRGPSTPPT